MLFVVHSRCVIEYKVVLFVTKDCINVSLELSLLLLLLLLFVAQFKKLCTSYHGDLICVYFTVFLFYFSFGSVNIMLCEDNGAIGRE